MVYVALQVLLCPLFRTAYDCFTLYLKFQQLPAYLPIQAQPILVLSKLKQHFPLFNRGNEANEITEFASVTWNDGITDHQVLLFKYHYVNNLPILQDQNSDKK